MSVGVWCALDVSHTLPLSSSRVQVTQWAKPQTDPSAAEAEAAFAAEQEKRGEEEAAMEAAGDAATGDAATKAGKAQVLKTKGGKAQVLKASAKKVQALKTAEGAGVEANQDSINTFLQVRVL